MATTSRGITREELAQFLPNHKLVKAFENLTEGVTVILPTELEVIRVQVDENALAVGAAQSSAVAAMAIAMATAAQQDLSDALTQISALRAEVDALRTQVQDLQIIPA